MDTGWGRIWNHPAMRGALRISSVGAAIGGFIWWGRIVSWLNATFGWDALARVATLVFLLLIITLLSLGDIRRLWRWWRGSPFELELTTTDQFVAEPWSSYSVACIAIRNRHSRDLQNCRALLLGVMPSNVKPKHVRWWIKGPENAKILPWHEREHAERGNLNLPPGTGWHWVELARAEMRDSGIVIQTVEPTEVVEHMPPCDKVVDVRIESGHFHINKRIGIRKPKGRIELRWIDDEPKSPSRSMTWRIGRTIGVLFGFKPPVPHTAGSPTSSTESAHPEK